MKQWNLICFYINDIFTVTSELLFNQMLQVKGIETYNSSI